MNALSKQGALESARQVSHLRRYVMQDHDRSIQINDEFGFDTQSLGNSATQVMEKRENIMP
ncbi:hypothetical protein SDJN02_17898, partial [Cucurbita argyrosperma subsp. argyrosperma]